MGALNRLRRWLAGLSPGSASKPTVTTGAAGDPAGPPTSGTTTTTGPAGVDPLGGIGGLGGLGAGRLEGEPPSGNGASSFHLFWDLPGDLVAVSATLEVREAPTVDRLYFWALQAGFIRDGRRGGAGHLGLQFHPQYPGRTAVNWGGYDERGRVLAGTSSALPSSLGNPHTRDFEWRAGRRYRLAIEAAPPADQPGGGRTAWRGTVTELDGDAVGRRVTVVRDLLAEGDRLTQPMVWTEAFARCEHPSAEVRWTDLDAMTVSGETVRPAGVRVNYQAHADGGCANTSCWLEDGALVQRTATTRSTQAGSRLALFGTD